jgi:hypothetical protein
VLEVKSAKNLQKRAVTYSFTSMPNLKVIIRPLGALRECVPNIFPFFARLYLLLRCKTKTPADCQGTSANETIFILASRVRKRVLRLARTLNFKFVVS